MAEQDAASRIEAYLATAPKAHRAALQQLRRTITAAVPEAEEVISYGMPAFKYRGKLLAGYASFKEHCSYFPMSGTVTARLSSQLERYVTSKGGIQFDPEKPLSTALIKKLLEARMEEIEH